METPQANAWQWDETRWRGTVERVRAGRSLKPNVWPGGAQVAVALSFDSDHETSELRDGGSSPGRLSRGQYGSRVGMPRILNLLALHELKATFFVPAVSALLHPEEQRSIVAQGHEIGLHGWIHERNGQLAEQDERDLMLRSADALKRVCGKRPVGVRTPSWDFSPNTLTIMREMELLYDSSLMADEEPYELMQDGVPTGIVELPVETMLSDSAYFDMGTYMPASSALEVFRAEFDGAYSDHGMFLLTMHPHVIGRRSRLTMLETLIVHMKSKQGVWFATHEEIARHVKKVAALE
ncbi:polysaccharide deacetylase [Mesorhizobium australicum]|uniref:polysaccharide deacetylase family protein n=1 Tax=Mesorhizobium australicum TaxID=536018 RepID=UPI00333BC1F2